MPAKASREFHVVVFGASGFVGRLVAGHLAHRAPPGLRVGLAGRDRGRIAAVRDTLGDAAAAWPILVADAADAEALRGIAEATSVVATTVGPYAKFGVPLVGACAAAGTDYADLTGEVWFVRRSIDAFHAAAAASGARIVHACGFDSIPSDLGVLLAWRGALADGAGPLGDTTLVMRKAKGGFSGGTIDSLRHQLRMEAADPAVGRLVRDPHALCPDRAAEPAVAPRSFEADLAWPRRDARLGQWVGPFVMAPFNTRVVRRSHALLDRAYGPHFRYREVVGLGTGATAPLKGALVSAVLGGLVAGLRFGPTRLLLDRLLPRPGEGPGQEARDNGMFALDVVAETASGARYRTRVAARCDPGYAATALMLGESALALALDDGRLPDRAGVLTPAVALGEALAERLRAAGMTFDTEPLQAGPVPG